MCSNCFRPGHNRRACPSRADEPDESAVTELTAEEPLVRAGTDAVPFFENHVEAIRLRLALLSPDELERVRRMVEERIRAAGGSDQSGTEVERAAARLAPCRRYWKSRAPAPARGACEGTATDGPMR